MLNFYYLSCNSGNQPIPTNNLLSNIQQYIARMQHIRLFHFWFEASSTKCVNIHYITLRICNRTCARWFSLVIYDSQYSSKIKISVSLIWVRKITNKMRTSILGMSRNIRFDSSLSPVICPLSIKSIKYFSFFWIDPFLCTRNSGICSKFERITPIIIISWVSNFFIALNSKFHWNPLMLKVKKFIWAQELGKAFFLSRHWLLLRSFFSLSFSPIYNGRNINSCGLLEYWIKYNIYSLVFERNVFCANGLQKYEKSINAAWLFLMFPMFLSTGTE